MIVGKTYPARILAVDDDPLMREFARHELALPGAVVETAEDGEAGLVALARSRFDLVVLDLEMPRVDGLAFLRALPRLNLAHIPPVLVLTSRSDAPTIAAAFSAGAVGYSIKPVDWPALRTKIGAVYESAPRDHGGS